MESTIEIQIIENLLRGKSTNAISDGLSQARILSIYKGKPEYDYVKARILEMRNSWIAWRFNAQREWYKNKRHPHNHDSFEMRESYVAPHENNYELERSFTKKARNYMKTVHSELFTGYNAY
jgi:hypothetical protein